MPKISLGPFKGEIPLMGDRVLPKGNARFSQNANVEGGELRAWGRPLFIQDLNPGASPGNEVKTIYQYETSYWLNWMGLVSVRPGFLADDAMKRLYWVGDGAYPKKGDLTAITNSDSTGPLPYSSYRMGVKAPTSAPVEGTSVPGASTTTTDVTYVYTLVSDWGEESAPSDPLTIVDVPVDTFADTGTEYIQLTLGSVSPGAPYNMDSGVKRLYRSVVSGTDATYLFVTELPIATTTFNDDVPVEDLGEVIPSYRVENDEIITWDEPVDTVVGMCSHPGQFFVMWHGNTLTFTEPLIPYASPRAYDIDLDHEIIAAGVVGNTIVVATDGVPYVVTGDHPIAMSVERLPYRQPCVAAASFKEGVGSCVWATHDGLFQVAPGQARLYTAEYFRRDQWQAFDPTSIVAEIHDGKYFAYYRTTSGEEASLIFDPTRPDNAVGRLTPFTRAPFSSLEDDALYVVDGSSLYKWDGDQTAKLVYDWLSREEVSSKPMNFGAARVDGDFGAITEEDVAELEALRTAIAAANASLFNNTFSFGAFNGEELNAVTLNGDGWQVTVAIPTNTLSFRYYSDGELVFEQVILSEEPFRLPSGKLSRRHQVEVIGDIRVRDIELGNTRSELG